MKLTDLEPEWMAVTHGGFRSDGLTRDTAQGIMFLCPACFAKNKGPVGTHSVLLWFRGRGVLDDEKHGSARWNVSGTGFHDLTLTPSIDLGNGDWHGFITNGEVT